MSRATGGSGEGSWRFAQGAVLVLVAGFFLYSLRDLLNPFLLYCVVIALLAPFRGVRGHALLVTVATLIAGVWVLDTAGSLLAPFFLAFVLAYILDPIADRVSAHPRINRTAAIFLILVPAETNRCNAQRVASWRRARWRWHSHCRKSCVRRAT